MEMIHAMKPEDMEQMRQIAKQPAGRIDNIIYLKSLLNLPDLSGLSFMSIENYGPRKEKKIWMAGARGIIILDGYHIDPRLYGILTRGNGYVLYSLLPFEGEGIIFLNIFKDPITDTVVKAYGREYPVWICWSLTQSSEMSNEGFAIHQQQWQTLEPWLRKYLPLAS